MTVKIGISGFGRIGRCTLRTSLLQPEIEIAAINNRSVGPIMADLLKFDTVHGTWNHDVSYDEGTSELIIDGRRIPVTNHTDPADIPWKKLGVDVVVESTGKFKDRESASKHLAGGAKRVIITAPGKNPDTTIVMGVNEETYDPEKHRIISNGSCTTNCLAPVAKVLSLVLPELKGKFTGMALRVPTPNVSMTDLVAILQKKVTVEEVNGALKKWAEGPLKGILAYSEDATVSSDYISDPHSSIVDSLDTQIVEGDMIKVVAWYDNEWGYSLRVNDLAAYMATKGI